MRKPVHVFAPRLDADDSDVDVIFESPHTSRHDPAENPHPVAKVRLNSHEGYDPGALKLMRSLRQTFPFASFVISKTSRLYVEHNRMEACACPKGTSEEQCRYRVEKYYRPYIDAVFGTIDQSVTNDRLPLLFNIHTYEPELYGYKRKIFAVSGDHGAVLVGSFVRHLRTELARPDVQQWLTAERQKSAYDFSDQVDVNKPYDLSTILENGEVNPRRKENCAASYAAEYKFPWAHLEVRNDVAHLPIVLNIVNRAVKATINDSAVRADLEKRQNAWFGASEDAVIARIYAPPVEAIAAQPVTH